MSYIVYKHTTPNNKVYIGITKLSPNNRWRNGEGYNHQNYFYRAILKYGWENIKHEIVCEGLSKEQAEQMEIELIKAYKSNDPNYGYNIQNGGKSKGTLSEKELNDRRNRWIGENNPMYGVRRCGSNNPMYGKHWTSEQKKSHSEKLKGKLAGERNPMYGKHRSQEQKDKQSKRMSGKDNPRSIKVICVDTGQIFETMREASNKMNINYISITQCCKGKHKTAGGYVWKYVNDFTENLS